MFARPQPSLIGGTTMDATRARRTRDHARQSWYAGQRQWRFARHLGFPIPAQLQVPATTSDRRPTEVRGAALANDPVSVEHGTPRSSPRNPSLTRLMLLDHSKIAT